MALSANRPLTPFVDAILKTYPVKAATHVYWGGNAGKDPGGYVKPFEPGDEFVGVFDEEGNNSSGAAGAINVAVRTSGEFELSISGVSAKDIGRAVFCTADDAYALVGHTYAFFGRVVRYLTTDTAIVKMKQPGELPAKSDRGHTRLTLNPSVSFEPTGAASASKYHPDGFVAKAILGLGVLPLDAAGGGAKLEFDATAEVALASLRAADETFDPSKGITFKALLVVADKGDAAALDIDFGLGTALTTNSEASIDHADMVNLAAFHLDGNSDNINAQSDNNVTDVSNTDTTIDNDSTTDVPKWFDIIVRTTGAVEFWISGSRVLSSTTFAVDSATALAPFVNMEKTSDDTTAVIQVYALDVCGAGTSY